MKRLGSAILTLAAALAASCVSTPDAAAPNASASAAETASVAAASECGVPEAAAAPVRKERKEQVRVPVVTKETVTFADGVVDTIVEYSYTEGYWSILGSVTRKPSMPEPLERSEWRYHEDRLVAKESYGRDGALSSRSAFEYGPGGRLSKETVYDGKGLVQSVSEWTWEAGRKSSWRVLDAKGVALARTDYFYEGETLASASLFDGSGGPKGRVEYRYDASGALAELRYLGPSGAPDGRIAYELADGRVARESVYRADGRLERRLDYAYGPDGALVGKTLSDASGRAREKTSYDNAYRIETRVVVYYE